MEILTFIILSTQWREGREGEREGGRERERGRKRGREGEGVRGVYVRKIGTYLCSSMADSWVWMECVGRWVEHVGVGRACGGRWIIWEWVEQVGVGVGGACGGGWNRWGLVEHVLVVFGTQHRS